jgi:Dynamin family
MTTTQQLADRVTALAAAFQPGSGLWTSLAAELARADGAGARSDGRGQAGRKAEMTPQEAGPDNTELVADTLRRAAAHLAPRPVRLTVGGRFSSGKSSVINLLIETPLLPTSDYPETGVPCVITSGDADQVVVQTGKGTKKIDFTTAAIARYVTATGKDGTLRESIRDVQELRVTRGKPVIPLGAAWVDSPGIDDGMGEGDRHRKLAVELGKAGDVLVWVTPAGATFGETEADFVEAHYSEAGPASVAFVINKWLDADTAQCWQAAKARQGSYAALITKKLDPDAAPPPIALVSARAAAEVDPDGFGGPEVRALFAGLSDQSAAQVTVTRIFRALGELRDLMTKLDARVAAGEQHAVAENVRLDAARRERERREQEFKRAVRSRVSGLLRARGEAPPKVARRVEKRVMRGNTVKESPAYYGALFDQRLGRAVNRIAADVVKEINKVARGYRYGPLSSAGKDDVSRALRLRGARVSGFTPASDRGVVQRFRDWLNSEERKRDAIKSQLNSAARDASASILGATDAIVNAAARHCPLTAVELPAVDLNRLNGLREAQRTLEQNAIEPLRRALAAAQAHAGR